MGLVVAVVLSLFWIGLLILVIVASRADSSGQKRRSRGLRLKQTGFLLITVLLVRFGGNMVLSLFEMGWRCLPRNMMDLLWVSFLLALLIQGMQVLAERWESRPERCAVVALCGFALLISIAIGSMIHWRYMVWDDWSSEQNGQQIVVEKQRSPGSIGARRCYRYVNQIVHGERLIYQWEW